ncbi:acyltransferase family protein [Accumulibacter sp.]|uniref:acyltransferase family protein n=1 Tax=Accumulibacter sp. TaxID=2053492 RepID=UPI00262CD1FB|nr:acyltransferase family protein [Accumulibacter sp.]
MSAHTYRPEIDGLRALAVLPVILFHAGIPGFGGGYVGVDIFFVISGFLITSIILAERQSGRFSLVAFYERRARRILPALFLVMLVSLLAAWFLLMPKQFKEFGQSLVAVSIFGSNVLFWLTSGYFDAAAEEKPLLHTWSLGVEEQYYLLFPLLVMLIWRLGRRRQMAVLSAVLLASLAWSVWLQPRDALANFFLAPSRAWELLIGSLLAFVSQTQPLHQRVSKSVAQLLSLLGLALIAAAVFCFGSETAVPGLPALLPTLGTALVLGYAGPATLAGRVLSLRTVVGVGLLSYSAYLWHQPLFAFARLCLMEQPGGGMFAALSVLSLVLAYFTWRYVEVPLRNRRRIGRRAIFVLSFAGSLSFIGVGLLAHAGQGLPSRLDGATRRLAATAVPSPMRADCDTRGRSFRDPREACRYFGADIRWAVLGDSHGIEPAYALAEVLRASQQGVLHLSFSGCPPALLSVVGLPGCTAWQNRAIERIEGDAGIENVLVVFRYNQHWFGNQLDGYPRLPDGGLRIDGHDAAASRELLWHNFEALLARLQRAGKRVFVMGPIPELGRSVQKHLFASRFADSHFERGTSIGYFQARSEYIHARLRSLPWSERLIELDPARQLCDASFCYAVLDGAAMYYDDNHLSLDGARRVLAPLAPYLR